MLTRLLRILALRCPHRRISRPITPARLPGGPATEMYVVCLDCGEQFQYDWKHMRRGERIERERPKV